MRKIIIFILLALLSAPTLHAKIGRDYKATAKQYGFRLTKNMVPTARNISGTKLEIDVLESELDRFFAALELLPPEFIKKLGVSKVIICGDLAVDDKPVGGIAHGDTVYLRYGFHPRTVYHELFHVFDPKSTVNKWTKFNPRSFSYTGSYVFSNRQSGAQQRRRQNTTEDVDKHFVTKYAQSFEWEDRADTFAFMVYEGKDFLKRTAQSDVLKKKMGYIIEITSKPALMGPDYWPRRLAQ